MTTRQIDLAIIGGGVAGLTAGIFAMRAQLDTLLFERMGPGGQTNNVDRVENYPGFPEGISGFELGPRIAQQAMEAGLQFDFGEVTGLQRDEAGGWVLDTMTGEVRAEAVIVSTGSELRRLGLPREEELHGRGVSYCASCDAHFFTDQDVVVVGGGDSALDEALHLTEGVRSITVVHRGDEFSGAPTTAQKLLAHDKVRVLWNHEVREILGEDGVTGVVVADVNTGATQQLDVTGLFVFVGLVPNTSFLEGVVDLDAAGHIPVDLEMATPAAGLFAAGDIRQRSSRLFVSAGGDGATAAVAADRYIRSRRVRA